MMFLLERWINLLPASSFTKGLLGLGVWEDVWATDLPLSVLDLLDILEILVKKDDFRSKG